MTATPIRALVVTLLTTTLALMLGAPTATWAAGVVTSCDETNLNTALSGGGTVTFSCGGPATIIVTSTKTISANTTIDGGGAITISGGNSVQVFIVNIGVTFTVKNLTIANGKERCWLRWRYREQRNHDGDELHLQRQHRWRRRRDLQQ